MKCAVVVVEGKMNVVIVLYSLTNVHEAVLKKKNLESRVDVVVLMCSWMQKYI